MKKTLAALVTAACLAVAPLPADARPDHPMPQKTHFDLQAHRGGLGMTTESTLEGFAKAIELGVTTLELDTQVTEDGAVVITHDRQISRQKCEDTAPAFEGDPEYPYVGKYITNLTLAQVKTVNCGYQQLPGHPDQEVVAGPMVELKDLFSLVEQYKSKKIQFNIETKVEAGAPEQTAPREFFVKRVYEEIAAAGMLKRTTIQSFDWGALMEMHELDPNMPLVALTNHDFLQVGQEGASPWLGGIDADDFDGDFVAAAASIDGVVALSPVHGFPQNGKVSDPDYRFYVTREMVEDAHARGLKVIPWTVDDKDTVAALMDMGVDGIITDYPDMVRELMTERGMRLPKGHTRR